ncbi:MAG: hypothetical protein PHC56_10440 [Herbinix sp.]|nr:hypothetical protein [Herbinix sp.]
MKRVEVDINLLEHSAGLWLSKDEMDFVRMMSIFPCSQSSSILLNSA